MRLAVLLYTSRSGSTLLARLLAQHVPSMLVLPELRLPELLMARASQGAVDRPALRSLIRLDNQFSNLGLDAEEVSRLLEVPWPSDLRQLIERLARQLRSPDDSPSTVLLQRGTLLPFLPDILEQFREARFVHIFRDPRGQANSMLGTRGAHSRQRMGRGDVIHCSRMWKRYMRYTKAARSRWPDAFLEVSYENLLQQTEQTLLEVCRFLELPWSASAGTARSVVGRREREMHPLVELAPQQGRAQAWRRELPSWQRQAVELLTSPELEERGFQALPPAGSPDAVLARAWLVHAVAKPLYLLRRLPRHLRHPERLSGWLRFRVARRERRRALVKLLEGS